MIQEKWLKLIIIVIVIPAFLAGCGGSTPPPISDASAATATAAPAPNTPTPTAIPEPPHKILFIGNSFTYWSGGLDLHLEQLAASAEPPLVIEADKVVRGGASLQILWEYTRAPQAIAEGDYDVVVLQEDIPVTDVATFHQYARKFVAEIKKTGAEPVLFMAWSYEPLGWITTDEIAQAHRDIATELDIEVIPVGLAWQRAMAERPALDMYAGDAEHPSVYGSYLAVNVVYGTLVGKSPVGLPYRPPELTYALSNGEFTRGVSDEEAAFLQHIAWETVQAYQASTTEDGS